jgi:hypothetical protein
MRGVHNASGEGCSHRGDIAQRQSPETIRNHGYLHGEGCQGSARPDIRKLLERSLFLLCLGSKDLGDESKDGFNRGAATP